MCSVYDALELSHGSFVQHGLISFLLISPHCMAAFCWCPIFPQCTLCKMLYFWRNLPGIKTQLCKTSWAHCSYLLYFLNLPLRNLSLKNNLFQVPRLQPADTHRPENCHQRTNARFATSNQTAKNFVVQMITQWPWINSIPLRPLHTARACRTMAAFHTARGSLPQQLSASLYTLAGAF